MAVASLPLSRLSLLQSSPSSPAAPSCHQSRSLRLAASRSFAICPLAHESLARRGFFFSEVKRRPLISIVAAATTPKKVDSAAKRARQAEKRRIYNRAGKSEITTRMKKVFVALEELKKQTTTSQDMLLPIETLISEAFSTIDKAVKVGTLHRNTGAHRKSRLSRAKKTVEVQLGWYSPNPSPVA